MDLIRILASKILIPSSRFDQILVRDSITNQNPNVENFDAT
jgi:hypothetical protein